MRKPKYPVKLAEEERVFLEQIVRNRTTAQQIVQRARIILLADMGITHREIVERLAICLNVVTHWTKRWSEKANDPIERRLQDKKGRGRRQKITPPQVCKLIGV